MEKGKKLAVLVGCDYPNGLDLTDEDGSSGMPTGANIMKALN